MHGGRASKKNVVDACTAEYDEYDNRWYRATPHIRTNVVTYHHPASHSNVNAAVIARHQ